MKNLIVLFIFFLMTSCVSTSPSSNTNNQTSVSPEIQARKRTTEMKNVLGLNAAQEEKVLLINVVNFSLLKKLTESNQTSQIPLTYEKYRMEIKEVLNPEQYSKFLDQFGNL
ncbi:hypothetical protein [Lacihabitans sp. CS3-21]|uniref:hypothetical protein n=1 Tax=Lacihabitans sp. CS3-21 TaxID=2487332 RepID=UPI0020CE2C4E|nr:hypothetical protein [Lacihabitans sp. CS3-21]